MNKIFKIIWNKTTQRLEVVSELAKSQGKATASADNRKSLNDSSVKRFKLTQGLKPLSLLVAFALAMPSYAVKIAFPNSQNGSLNIWGSDNKREGTVNDQIAQAAVITGAGNTLGDEADNGTFYTYDNRITGKNGQQNPNGINIFGRDNKVNVGNKVNVVGINNKILNTAVGNSGLDLSINAVGNNITIMNPRRSSYFGNDIYGNSAYLGIGNNLHIAAGGQAVGTDIRVAGDSMAIGSNITSDKNNNFLVGDTINAINANQFISGKGITSGLFNATLLGKDIKETGGYADGAFIAGNNVSLTVPQNNQASKAVVMGVDANITGGVKAVTIGSNVTSNSASNSVTIGSDISTTKANTVTVGSGNTNTEQAYSIAIGHNASTKSQDKTSGVAIGQNSQVTKEKGVALGYGAQATGIWTAAVGPDSRATEDFAVAMGNNANATATKATAIGFKSTAGKDSSLALGDNATANYSTGDVALGASSTTAKKNDIADFTIGTTKISDKFVQAIGNMGVVSVGSNSVKRQIQNVAAGNVSASSTDAINGSQLFHVATELNNIVKDSYLHVNSTKTGNRGVLNAAAGATGTNSIALGPNATASAASAIAIGDEASNTAAGGVSIGQNAINSATNSTVIGRNAQVTAGSTDSVAIGLESIVTCTSATAIGKNANASGASSISIGQNTLTQNSATIALGYNVSATANNATAIGSYGNASGTGSITLGAANASHTNAIAIGTGANASASSGTAVGSGATASGTGGSSSAFGQKANATNTASVAIGYQSNATGCWTTAVGPDSLAQGDFTVAMGNGAKALSTNATAIGRGTQATGDEATAVGRGSVASAANATTLGAVALAGQAGAVALGRGATANITAGDVAIGDSSATAAANTVSDFTIGTTTFSASKFVNATANGTVSVGSSSIKRQIQNVGAGAITATSSDAINGSQLYHVASTLNAVTARKQTFKIKNSETEKNTADSNANEWTLNKDNEVTFGATSDLTVSTDGKGNIIYGLSKKAATAVADIANIKTDVADAKQKATVASTAASTAVSKATAADSKATAVKETVDRSGLDANGQNTKVGSGSTYAGGSNATAIGGSAKATKANTTAVGQGSEATAEGATAIGQGAKATGENAVAIGTGSVADEAHTVSVGSQGNERRITNVAAGRNPTDAANVGQIYAAENRMNNKLGKLDKKLRGGIASAVAVANIPQVTIPGANMVAVGAGNYKGQSAVAVGYSRASDNNRVIIKMSAGASTQRDYTFGAGIGYQW